MAIRDLEVVQELFSKPYRLKRVLERRKVRFEELEQTTGYMGPVMSACPKVSSDMKKSSVENLVIKRFDAQESYNKTKEELDAILSQVYDLLSYISDSEAVEYIEQRHIDGMSWKDIIDESCHSESTVFDHYSKAMHELNNIWKSRKTG